MSSVQESKPSTERLAPEKAQNILTVSVATNYGGKVAVGSVKSVGNGGADRTGLFILSVGDVPPVRKSKIIFRRSHIWRVPGCSSSHWTSDVT